MKKCVLAVCVFLIAALGVFGALAFADGGSSTVNSNKDAATSIVIDSAAFGLQDVERSQVGMNKTVNGAYYGYVFPLGKNASYFSVVVTNDKIIAYIPAQMAQDAGFDISDPAQCSAFESMLTSLDTELSDGGVALSSLNTEWVFTSSTEYASEGYAYTFDTGIDGYTYVVCKGADKESSREAAKFCLSGSVLPKDQVTVADDGGWLGQLMKFLSPDNMDYRPLWVSLKTAGVAMIFIFILGILAARKAMNVKSRWKGLFDSLFTIPMVLPPTVCGFILLVIFGSSTPFGRWLMDHGIQLVFSWPAAVLAATVVGFPLMYRTVLGAFEALDTNMLDAARTLGWSEGRIFRKLMLPLAWPSIAAGIVLAFARAMGEFGATLFVAGNYAGVTQTMPIAIYFAWMGGNSPVAVFWVVVVIIISFVIILIINVYSAHAQRYRKAGGKGTKEDAIYTADPSAAGEVAFAIDEHMAAELGFNAKHGTSIADDKDLEEGAER